MWTWTIRTLLLCLLSSWVVAAPGDGFSFEKSMGRLSHEEFKTREAAQGELLEWGKGRVVEGIETFYQAFRTHEDPEVRLRCRALVKELVILKQADEGQGYIGIMMLEDQVIPPGGEMRRVVRITKVIDGTPGEKAGLLMGDLVTGIDKIEFGKEEAVTAFGDYVRSKKPKEKVTLKILRRGEAIEKRVELMRRPPMNERNLLWGNDFIPPDQKTVEEEEFQRWLKKRAAEEKAGN